jgi:ribulose 1,5-bisphosphate synthetase/thiazole synthase
LCLYNGERASNESQWQIRKTMVANKQVMVDRERLPVLADSDLVVAGGSFGGVAAALAAAEAGIQVVLVEPRTYLGREMTACLRPFMALKETEAWPSLVASCVEAAGVPDPEHGMVAFQLATLKTHLEDRLLDAGVKILYACLPMGLVTEAERIVGIVIGNKSGRQVIRARALVDATETELLFRLAQGLTPTEFIGVLTEGNKNALFFRSLEFDKVGEVAAGPLSVPEELGIAENEVRVVPGAQGEGHWLVECPLSLLRGARDPFDLTAREIMARNRTMALGAYLRKHVKGFEKAYLASASQLLAGQLAVRWAGISAWTGELDGQVLSVRHALADIPLAEMAGPLKGLFGLRENLRSSFDHNISEVVAASAVGEALGKWLGKRLGEETAAASSQPTQMRANEDGSEATQYEEQSRDDLLKGRPDDSYRQAVESLPDLKVMELVSPQRGRRYRLQRVSPVSLPVLRSVDVLVIGGGTSGTTAAYAAAKSGANTLLVEAAPGLGGTGTFGGVHSYWFGRRVGFSQQIIQAVEAMHAELGLDPPEGGLLKWNIEGKMHALLRRVLDAGVEVLWGVVTTGTLVEGQQVRGVIVATHLGPAALCAKVIIDATGDGDVAYFAGAPVVYGSSRDHATMWFSIAQFYRPGMTQNNFTSMVDVGNVEDYTRAVLAGRRRVKGVDQGTYIAPRESRHVLGDVVLSLNDQLLKRCWPDTVYVAFSNHDIKGHSSSDWLRVGLIPPNLEVEIPYRALLPKGLEGILIAGKAFSATHDALPPLRMQPDMENLGGVAGTAAAMAVNSRCSPREIDVRILQQKLAASGVLPEPILHRTLQPKRYTRGELEILVDQLSAAKPLNRYQDMELDEVFEGRIPFVDLCCAGPAALPVLKSALEKRQGLERLILAKALAMMGSAAGVQDLIAAIHAETPDEGLQVRQVHIRHVQNPPDQGAMPEAANLLYTLGMARDERALPVWDHFSTLIAETIEADIRDRNLGLFFYVDAICFGAERLGDPRAVPFLKRIHACPTFRGRSASEGFETDFFLERQAYLELVIARALARCGDKEGYAVLISYLNDARALLAEHAHSELKAITGQDFGKDAQGWHAWLSATELWRVPHPVQEPNEAIQAWDEQILRWP